MLPLFRIAMTISLCLFTVISFGENNPPIDTSRKHSEAILIKLNEHLDQIDHKLQSTDSLQKATFKELTRDTFWEDIKRNLVASFIYDILGFNGHTTGSLIAKLLSLLYLIYLFFRARVWWIKWKKKEKKFTALDFFGALLTFAQAAFAFFVFFASLLFSNDDLIDKKAFNKANKSIQSLNKELATIKSVDFIALSKNLKKVEELKMDTLRPIDAVYLSKIDSSLTKSIVSMTAKLQIVESKLVNVESRIKDRNRSENFATSGWQTVQTIIILLLFIVFLLVVYYDFKRKNYI
jgi:hypothetical protein